MEQKKQEIRKEQNPTQDLKHYEKWVKEQKYTKLQTLMKKELLEIYDQDEIKILTEKNARDFKRRTTKIL